MTDWTLVVAVLGLGLLLGGGLILLLGRKGAEAESETPDPVGDLRAERDLLLAQLRELDLEEGEEVAAQRYELELRAARVLRDLDRAARIRPHAPPSPPPPASAARGFAWGLGVAAFAVLLVSLAMNFSRERPEGAPITGAPLGAGDASGAPESDPELLAFIARVEQEPENHGARLDLVQALLARDRFVDAWPFIQQLAAVIPNEPRLLLYEATVREAMGQWERARALLDRALEGDEGLTEAWVRRGLVSFELGDWAVAASSWERALEQRPDGRAVLEPVIAEAKRRLEEGEPPPAREGGGPPSASAEAEGSDEAAGSILIRVELSEEAKARAEGKLLFVTARPAGVRAGPPVAAKRIPVDSFPLDVELGPADSMMGQPFPASARIEARLDRDGNAMTQEPDEPRATADEVEPGSRLTLVLE